MNNALSKFTSDGRTISLNLILVSFCFFWYLSPLIFLAVSWDLFLPIYTTCLIFFLLGLLVGSYPAKHLIIVDRVRIPDQVLAISCIVILTITFLLQSIPLAKIFSGEIDGVYRELIFNDSTALFGSSKLYTLYNIILLPLIVFGLCITPTCKRRVIALFWLLILCLIIDAVIKFGRFPIFYAIFFIAINFRFLKINMLKSLFSLIILIFGMQFLLYLRQYEIQNIAFDMEFILTTISESVLQYNLIGPLLFEYFADNSIVPVSLINFASFSSLIVPIELIAGLFDESLWYPWKDQIIAISQPIYFPILQREVNAFGTNFMPLYLDFAVFGPLFLGLLTGFLLSVRVDGKVGFSVKVMTAFITIFGVYQSYIVMPYTLFVVLPFFFGFLKIKREAVSL